MSPSASRAHFHPALRVVLRVALIAWAAFWAWFVLAVAFGGAEAPPPSWIPAAWLAAVAALVVLGWKRPAVGGTALVAAGIASASYFDHPAARVLLAAPAVLLGVGCLMLRWSERRAGVVAIVLLCVALTSCLAPQDPADLPYRTSSILRHESGRMQRAYLVEPTEIEGIPCRGWVWWHADGSVDNLELYADRVVQGHSFPEGTRLFFDSAGRLAHAWLSRDARIDGLLCRGRWKIDTAFHPNGHVKAFFPPREIEIDGVSCAASVFAPVYLHPDGRLRQCKLARDVLKEGFLFEKGDVLTLDASGRTVRRATAKAQGTVAGTRAE